MGVYELLWGLGAAALLIALAWAAARYRRSNEVDEEAAEPAAQELDASPERREEKS